MGLMDSLARRAIIAAPASIIVRVPAIIARFPVPVTHLIQAENGKSAKMPRWEHGWERVRLFALSIWTHSWPRLMSREAKKSSKACQEGGFHAQRGGC
jgi:hypothetical protein